MIRISGISCSRPYHSLPVEAVLGSTRFYKRQLTKLRADVQRRLRRSLGSLTSAVDDEQVRAISLAEYC